MGDEIHDRLMANNIADRLVGCKYSVQRRVGHSEGIVHRLSARAVAGVASDASGRYTPGCCRAVAIVPWIG